MAVEALVRWDQPGRGQLLPAEFVPFAEETGLIVPLGAWVLSESCRQAARWRANGPRTLPPTVHVNLSPRQFAEPHLIDLVAGALADTGTDPDRLCLEVTERALAANPASAATTLKRLSALGVHVSVDDFGTGYSSLASLQYLPLSSLKIDRSFVARLDLDPSDDAMVAAVIGLGHTLGLTVIAEGVETPASWPSSTSSAATTPRATCSPTPRPPPGSASSWVTTAAGSRAPGHLIASRRVTRNVDELEASPLWAPAELFALTGLVIAQPVLDVTGRSPDMFLFRRADRLDILLLVAAVTVLPALAIWVVEVAGRAGQRRRVRRHLHLAAITGLFVLLAVEVVKATTGLRGPRLAAVASAAGLRRGRAVRRPALAAAVATVPDPGPAGLRAAVPRWSPRPRRWSCRRGRRRPRTRRRRPATGRRW